MSAQVAGSAEGISAFQMDIKVEGITIDIMKQVRLSDRGPKR